MCEHSGRLIAWKDGELEVDEAGRIARHVAACAECKLCLAEFKKVSGEFAAYCEAVLKSEQGDRSFGWVSLRWAAVAACAAGLILAVLVHRREEMEKPAVRTAVTDSSARSATKAIESRPAPAASGRRTIHRRRAMNAEASRTAASCVHKQFESRNANWVAEQPSVQIAIPAAAMFPPGALPDGVTFVADLSIGADGSAQEVRLQPQVSEFERRSSQP